MSSCYPSSPPAGAFARSPRFRRPSRRPVGVVHLGLASTHQTVRFAVLQALFSLIALGDLVLSGGSPTRPDSPAGRGRMAWIVGSILLYAPATIVEAKAVWNRILELTDVKTARVDCYCLSVVGYMGDDVLPARARRFASCSMDARTHAGKRTIAGTMIAERILDAIVISAQCWSSWPTAFRRRRPAHRSPAGDRRRGHRRGTCRRARRHRLRRKGALLASAQLARSLLTSARAVRGRPRGVTALGATVVLWFLEGADPSLQSPAPWNWTSAPPARCSSLPSRTSSPRCPGRTGLDRRVRCRRRLRAEALGGRERSIVLVPHPAPLCPLRADHRASGS